MEDQFIKALDDYIALNIGILFTTMALLLLACMWGLRQMYRLRKSLIASEAIMTCLERSQEEVKRLKSDIEKLEKKKT